MTEPHIHEAVAYAKMIRSVARALSIDWLRYEELRHLQDLDDDEALELREMRELVGEFETEGQALGHLEPLDLSVRCVSWSPTDDELVPDEYRVLLSTGGPEVYISGKLSENRAAKVAEIWSCDWFLSPRRLTDQDWVDVTGKPAPAGWRGDLLAFAQLYFGE